MLNFNDFDLFSIINIKFHIFRNQRVLEELIIQVLILIVKYYVIILHWLTKLGETIRKMISISLKFIVAKNVEIPVYLTPHLSPSMKRIYLRLSKILH